MVPADVWCAVLLDPSTLLDTGGVHEDGFPEHVMPRLFEIEHVEHDDVDNLRALTRRSVPVSSLHNSTQGDLATSKYYRDILRPLGLGDELRVLLRERGRTWGMFVMCREARKGGSEAGFSARDLAAARTFCAPTTRAVRRSLVATGTDSGLELAADGTGFVVLDEHQRLVECSLSAERLMARIEETPTSGRPKSCPHAVRAVAAAARASRDGETTRSLVRTHSGHWLTLHAWRLVTSDRPMTMVSIGPPEPGMLIALVLEAYGLSEQQRRIAQSVLLGRSSHEIVVELHITRNTLNDHLAKIFDKVGVRSQRELAGAIFARHYWPRIGTGPLALDGRVPLLPAAGA
ncbi:helix-turn-helix domain-containing protein [Yinghuangia soli]|uniref:Helix-turn-helix transcriptional regulator n=1 Tax=Yinghuangia soli TaxID=2908204 RepID=A0AA41PUD3_9ACTN|nr:helix-turn-helix transcriptional regulator [Yinghuangia soli]MCF2526043.1 helix-turn-helix transcriptional regulator [Yinghuangia soli]